MDIDERKIAYHFFLILFYSIIQNLKQTIKFKNRNFFLLAIT